MRPYVLIATLALWGAIVPGGARRVQTAKSLNLDGEPEVVRSIEVDGTELLEEQQAPLSDTTHTSWFERMGNAFWSVLVGLFVVIPFSISFLWVNERRAAQTEVVLGVGEGEVVAVDGRDRDLSEHDGDLVHLNSGSVTGVEALADERFPSVKMDSGCIKLRSVVQVFQWVEEAKKETQKDSLGGGTTTTTRYIYEKQWCSAQVVSSTFKAHAEHTNTKAIPALAVGSQETVNPLVKYGEAYQLQPDLVAQLNNFEDAGHLVGKTLEFASCSFSKQEDGWFHYPVRLAPEIGDLKVRFEYVLDSPATILALQAQDKDASRTKSGSRTFAPYRTVPRSLFGGETGDVKEKRVAAARKGFDEIFQEEKCWDFGPFCCLCGCCNIVSFFFAAMPPQIYSVWPRQMTVAECFVAERALGDAKKWVMRLVGWLLLWIGFMMLFEPLSVFADVIPFIGPYLGDGLSMALGLVTFFLTLVVSSLLVSVAYLVYRPVLGMLYLGGTAVVLLVMSSMRS